MSNLNRRRILTGTAAVGLGTPLLAACGDDPASTDTSPTASAGTEIASTADIPVGGGKIFADQKVIVTQPTEGTFAGFVNVCTHQGCPLQEVTKTIDCGCHFSKFSIVDGSPQSGPAKQPLESVDLVVEGDSISLA